MEKNGIVSVEIDDLAYGGLGVGRVEGLVVFVEKALPGERVAEMTGVRLSAVWVTLHRGRERLLRLLTEEDRT